MLTQNPGPMNGSLLARKRGNFTTDLREFPKVRSMLFNSTVFLILFFAIYPLYWNLSLKWQHRLIIVGSMIFYGWYSIPFLMLFLTLIGFNYWISMMLVEKKSRVLLWSAIAVDAGLLFFFKYFYLVAQTIGVLTGNEYLANLRQSWVQDYDFQIELPIAISFYTFQIIAFVVDSYRGVIKEKIEPGKFFLFILFFPQFVAGPIMRSTDFLPQIDRPWIDRDRLLRGSLLLIQGIVKKVLLADRLGSYTAPIWASPESYDAVYLILILPSFLAQIYLDFSGYTDMARGLALSLGYDIPENFTGPFFSKSMQELWSRWHVTLSTWLRDYIYIPLGGSRQGNFRTSLNLWLTMAIGGLWHGANWNMLFWGVYLGTILIIERNLLKAGFPGLPNGRFFNGIKMVYTMGLFSFSAIFFAAPNLDTTVAILKGIFTFQRGMPAAEPGGLVLMILVAFVFNAFQYYEKPGLFLAKRNGLRYGMVGVFTFVTGFLVSLFGDVTGTFIYFQF